MELEYKIAQLPLFKGVDWITYGGSEKDGTSFCRPATAVEVSLYSRLEKVYTKLKQVDKELKYIKGLHGK